MKTKILLAALCGFFTIAARAADPLPSWNAEMVYQPTLEQLAYTIGYYAVCGFKHRLPPDASR